MVSYGRSASGGTYLGQNRAGAAFYAASPNTVLGVGTRNATPLVFATNNTERMRITSDGNVGIGCTSPNAVALLQMDSTTKGFLPPRMTSAQRNNISNPPEGLVIYNTTDHRLDFYNGSSWQAV